MRCREVPKRIDRDAAEVNLEMNVRARRQTARADQADELAGVYLITGVHTGRPAVAVQRRDAAGVRELDGESKAQPPANRFHRRRRRRNDLRAGRRGEVHAFVRSKNLQQRMEARPTKATRDHARHGHDHRRRGIGLRLLHLRLCQHARHVKRGDRVVQRDNLPLSIGKPVRGGREVVDVRAAPQPDGGSDDQDK